MMKNWDPIILLALILRLVREAKRFTVRIFACIGHREEVWFVMLFYEVLVVELLAIDGLPTSTLCTNIDEYLLHHMEEEGVFTSPLVKSPP